MWLLLILCMAAAVTESQLTKKYGCFFEKKSSYQLMDVRSSLSKDIVYGEEVDPMKFESIEELKEMVENVHSIYTQLIEEYVFNNVSQFFEYYDAQKNSLRNPPLSEFYGDYLPQTTSLFSIELLDRIVENNTRVTTEHCYLVASAQNINSALLRVVLHSNQYGAKDSVSKSHGPEAAAIRIEVNERKGVILMDSGHSFFGPVVLMDDEIEPHAFFSRTIYEGRQESPQKESDEDTNIPGCGGFIHATCNYIFSSHTTHSEPEKKFSPLYATTNTLGEMYSVRIPGGGFVVVKKIKNNETNHDLYYTRQPFCSFVTTMIKYNLRKNSTRSIYRRDGKGYLKASISFDFNSKHCEPEFTMTMQKEGHTKFEMNIKYGHLDSLNQTEEKNYNAVIRELKTMDLNIADILTKAKTVANDNDFISSCNEICWHQK